MNKFIITNAVISKGYDNAPALKFSDDKKAVQFKIGERVYDKNAENSHRYVNYAVKAFGALCERIDKMKLKDGSFITVSGRMDEEKWEANGQNHSRWVIIADDVEYSGGDKSGGDNADSSSPANGSETQNSHSNQTTESQSGFTGYEGFGDENNVFF